MTLYRDPLAGLRSQIATKRGVLDSHERRLPPLLRALFPARLTDAIAHLRDRAVAEGETLEALSDADGALDGILAAYEEALELLPRLRECPEEVPDPPRPKQAPPWIIEENRQRLFRKQFEARVLELAPESYLVRWGDQTYLTRLRIERTPIVATARIVPREEITSRFWCAVRSSVPRATPPLHVRMEGPIEGLGKLLGLVEDRKVGNRELDDAFTVGGSEGALGLLTSDVSAALLSLVRFKPALRVASGIAEVAWEGSDRARPADTLPDSALAILLGVRAAIERA